MPLCIAIRFQNNVCARSMFDRERIEWPPHPDRLFQAMVNGAYHMDDQDEALEVLRWLEILPPPSIQASQEIGESNNPTYFCPSHHFTKSGKLKFPVDKNKLIDLHPVSEVTFPFGYPKQKEVYYIWEEEPSSQQVVVLEEILSLVPCIGSSESMVISWIEKDPPLPNLRPNSKGKLQIRIPFQGRLTQLQQAYDPEERKSKLSQLDSRLLRYDWVAEEKKVVLSRFDQLLFFTGPQSFSLDATLMLTNKLRECVMSKCSQQPIPEWISGHAPDGGRSLKEHIAVFPLPFVGSKYADGHIMGMGLAVPSEVDPENRKYLQELYQPFTLHMGTNGYELSVVDVENNKTTLQRSTWTRASKTWVTVTPIALDRYPKKSKGVTAAKIVANACLAAGLPEPADVVFSTDPLISGSKPIRNFPPFVSKHGEKKLVHAKIRFNVEVTGPILIGAGRYRGYGLCYPGD